MDIFDLVVIGGGINGAGIAADASGRNLQVALFEAQDFASATSSASSKLIHGGLRYLEYGEFRLVKEALKEREILLKKAPYLIYPLRFRLPHIANLRPVWLIRLGLFLYDYLGKRKVLAKSHYLRFDSHSPLLPHITEGFEYSDCWVDDARLVLANVVAAKDNGALVRNYCQLISAKAQGDHWQLELKDNLTQKLFFCRAKALVNAAGPWVEQLFKDCFALPSPMQIRLIKGSHIVVKAPSVEPHAYILQHIDGRIVFAIPYLESLLMIGTTDKDYHGSKRNVQIDENEKRYLLEVYNSYFKQKLTESDILYSFSGVRPLFNDSPETEAKSITRDYKIALKNENNLPLISIFGGKLTTYRKLAECAVDKLAPFFPKIRQRWTETSPLPGAEGISSYKEIEQALIHHYDVDKGIAHRLATSYGSRIWTWFDDHNDIQNDFGFGLSKKEVDFLIRNEFVHTAEDLLWRRSKLGIFISQEQQRALAEYINRKQADTNPH